MNDTPQKNHVQKDLAQKADPATFEIVKNSLIKIAEEMRVVLAKTAYSPILKSAGDYSCGVFDARGEMVAQGPDLPIHLGSMPDAVRAVVVTGGVCSGSSVQFDASSVHCNDAARVVVNEKDEAGTDPAAGLTVGRDGTPLIVSKPGR